MSHRLAATSNDARTKLCPAELDPARVPAHVVVSAHPPPGLLGDRAAGPARRPERVQRVL